MKNFKIASLIHKIIATSAIAFISALVTGNASALPPSQPPPDDPDSDYIYVTNQDGKYVGYESDRSAGGCVLTLTQVHSGGDHDYDVWECLENNLNPGVDQRFVLVNTNGDPLTEKSKAK